MFTLAGILSQSSKYRYLLILNAYLNQSTISVISQEVIFRFVFVYNLFDGYYKTSTIATGSVTYFNDLFTYLESQGYYKTSTIATGSVTYFNDLFTYLESQGYFKYSNLVNNILTVQNNTAPSQPPIVTDSVYNNLILSDTPVVFLPLQDNFYSLGYTADLSGNTHNTTASGTGRNTKFFSSGSNIIGRPIVKGASQSCQLGINNGGYFQVWSPLSNVNNTFTIEFWFRSGTVVNNKGLIGCDQTLTGSTGRVWFTIILTTLNASNKVIAYDANAFVSPNFNTTWIDNTNYYLVATFDNTSTTLFINGVAISTQIVPSSFVANLRTNSTNTSFFWHLGYGYNTARSANAFFSHVATYNYVLPQAKITSHYNAGLI